MVVPPSVSFGLVVLETRCLGVETDVTDTTQRSGSDLSRRRRLRAGSTCCPTGSWHDHGVSTNAAEEQRLRDLELLRKVKDRIDRDYAQPLNVEALAHGVHM